jgi:hypothetical protein
MVSALALIIRFPTLRSFAQWGTSPQRRPQNTLTVTNTDDGDHAPVERPPC